MKKIILFFGWCLFGINASAQLFQNGDLLIGSDASIIHVFRGEGYQDYAKVGDNHLCSTEAMCFSTNKTYLFAGNLQGGQSSRITLFVNGACPSEITGGIIVNHLCRDEIMGNTENIFSGSNVDPASVVSDAFNNLYVGTGPRSGTTTGRIYKFNLQGNLLDTYYPESESGNINSIDLSMDQSTLYYVDGNKIKRYNLQFKTQLPDFIALPDNQKGLTIRLSPKVKTGFNLPTERVFVATGSLIYQYDSNGQLLISYPVNSYLQNGEFIDICFDIDNSYFWAAVYIRNSLNVTPRIFKIKIDDGSSIKNFNAIDNLNDKISVHCIIVYGAKTAATTQCSDGYDNNNNGLIDYPADSKCSSCDDNSECVSFLGIRFCFLVKAKLIRNLLGFAVIFAIALYFYLKWSKNRKTN
jgi:hypothetical protein